MEKEYRIGILGATGAVGQNYTILLENHPWFKVTYLAASPNSAGKKYSESVKGKWFMDKDVPLNLRDLVVGNASKIEDALGKCDFVFSSYEGTKEDIQKTEMEYAASGIPIISNNSAHRWTEDVPMIIPEINADHAKLIEVQKINRGFKKGFVVTKPNCSIQSYLTPVFALMEKGYFPKKIIVSTEQALSGAGYPGVPSLAILDNVIPYIVGEAEKTEKEPLKVLGLRTENKIQNYECKISATCTRVNVKDGHLAMVNLEFAEKKPSLEEIIDIWNNFKAEPQRLNLLFAPEQPIIYKTEEDRPQPRKDRDNDKGMAITVGRLRKCDALDIKFIGLSHNTIRGAAGGAILTAEYLAVEGYL